MRLQTFILIFQLTQTNVFGQIEVDLFFKNSCNDSVYTLEYSLFDKLNRGEYINSSGGSVIVPAKSTYHLYVSEMDGDFVHSFDYDIIVNGNLTDTLLIPNIKFTTGAALHSKFWSYFNCNRVCNGTEIDYYTNGNKRIEGEFISGKPKTIVEYREDGTKQYESWYKPGRFDFDRLNKFDNSGKLKEYQIKKFKSIKKTITLTYDSNDKLLDREVTKHTIER